MSERDRYQPGVPCWVDTLQPDPEAAMRFYEELMGWDFTGPGAMQEQDGRYFVAQVSGRDVAGIGTQPGAVGGQPATWSTYVSVASADETARRAGALGGTVLAGPFDVAPAGRLAVLADPTGATLCLWEPKQRQGAQLVNHPSAWAMSVLQTPDPRAAKEFYGQLFGWSDEPVEMAGAELTLMRLTGYVGGEPEQPVPRDVVAAMVANPAGEPGWSIDFWIADADAAAATAARLGGQVVLAPHDRPGFRSAVLADPQGAVFSVSQLQYESNR
ncbi:MAG: VOC family protein [Solirubrobacterales bacterium]|nr:VOC family protein [Solirubrobacterales bacterium]